MSDLKIGAPTIAIERPEPKALDREKSEVGKHGALDKEKLRLRKATREFESFFMQSMLKSMRATVPKADESDGAPGGGFGKDIFESMFDQELSKKMSEQSIGGLGDMLYRKLLPRLDASARAPRGNELEMIQGETTVEQGSDKATSDPVKSKVNQ